MARSAIAERVRARSNLSDRKSRLPGRAAQPDIATGKEPPTRLLFAPNQCGGEMQRVSSAEAKALELNAGQIPHGIARLDFAPRGEKRIEPFPRDVVSSGANYVASSQSRFVLRRERSPNNYGLLPQ